MRKPSRTGGLGYLAGGGVVKISRRAGSGLGFGLGAFFASLRPLSFCPMSASVPQLSGQGKASGSSSTSSEFAVHESL